MIEGPCGEVMEYYGNDSEGLSESLYTTLYFKRSL